MRSREKGFALLVVMVLLVIAAAAATLSLEEGLAALRSFQGTRIAESSAGAVEQGLDAAMADIRAKDVAELVDGTLVWDIFSGLSPVGAGELIPPIRYPTSGPEQDRFRVRVGLVHGQRTGAMPGEDVQTSYGQVLEVQIGVDADAIGVPLSERRATIGVLVPLSRSHQH